MTEYIITTTPSNKETIRQQVWDLVKDRIHEFIGDTGEKFGIDEFCQWFAKNAHYPVFIYDGDKLVFCSFLLSVVPSFNASVHWLIHPDYRNTENLQKFGRKFLDRYFQDFKLLRVDGLIPAYDEEWQDQHTHIGMRKDGLFRKQFTYNGKHYDGCHYSILRGEFYAH